MIEETGREKYKIRLENLLKGKGLEKPKLINILDEGLSILSLIIDEEGPIFRNALAKEFYMYELLEGDQKEIYEQLSLCLPYAKEKYGIKIISLKEALELIWGDFNKAKLTKGVELIDDIFYKNEDSLKGYVKLNTTYIDARDLIKKFNRTD